MRKASVEMEPCARVRNLVEVLELVAVSVKEFVCGS